MNGKNRHGSSEKRTFAPIHACAGTEKQIEGRLTAEVKAAGGIALKLVSPGFDGMPDRLVLMPGGHVGFVEVKAPGRKPRALQSARHRMLRGLGFGVYVLDDEGRIGGIIDDIQTT